MNNINGVSGYFELSYLVAFIVGFIVALIVSHYADKNDQGELG